MLPSIFGENLFDEFFQDPFDRMSVFSDHNPLYGKHGKNLMKTDVRETENTYELDVDLPGFKKDEVQLELKDGCLTISAAKGLDKDEEEKNGRYLRRERYAGQCSRSFYVGDHVEAKDVSAKFEDGILKITLPKMVQPLLLTPPFPFEKAVLKVGRAPYCSAPVFLTYGIFTKEPLNLFCRLWYDDFA